MSDFAASVSRRLPLPPEEGWSEETRVAIRRVVDGPRGALLGPFVPLVRSAGLLEAVQQTGEFIRYRSGLQGIVLETLVLTVAVHWQAEYEWSHHAPIAAKVGLSATDIDHIARGNTPLENAEATLVWSVVTEVLANGNLSDDSYRRAVERWGEQLIVEVIAATGYYTLLAWVLNVAQVLPDENEG